MTAAADYDARLRGFFEQEEGALHLALLGLGEDGHTAGLFGGVRDVPEGRYAVAVERPDGLEGVTVTPEVLRRARHVLFFVAGEGKREVVERLQSAPRSLAAGRAVEGHPSCEVWYTVHRHALEERSGRSGDQTAKGAS